MTTLIISGGELEQDFLLEFIKNKQINRIIAVDKGLEILNKTDLLPNYIIGDFDSVNKQTLERYTNQNIEIIKLNPEKDFSDTHMALKLAIELKSSKIYIVGALGKRIDHMMANIHILKEALDNKVKCKIIDRNNEIELITKGETKVRKTTHKYVSVFPLTTEVAGITLKGFKYKLNNAVLSVGHSIGVSNELISDNATIHIKEGILIIVKSND